MFRSLNTAVIYEIVSFLLKNRQFFEGNDDERRAQLEGVNIPKAFRVYLHTVDAEQLMSDIRTANKAHVGDRTIQGNGLLKSLAAFLVGPFSLRVEMMNEYANFKDEKRREAAQKLIAGDTMISQTLRQLLLRNSYQELASQIGRFAKQALNAPHVVVQSPRPIDIELKKTMRESLTQKYPMSFPLFQTNRQLIGGFRVFVDGEVVDHSWISRVLRFTSLTAAQ